MMAGMAHKVPTLAQTLGFPRDVGQKSLFACIAVTADEDRAIRIHTVAMDLARFCMVPLEDATVALCLAEAGQFGRLKRYGFRDLDRDYLDTISAEIGGMAAAYAKTIQGVGEVMRAIRV